jgi:hypothetical protein
VVKASCLVIKDIFINSPLIAPAFVPIFAVLVEMPVLVIAPLVVNRTKELAGPSIVGGTTIRFYCIGING